MPALPERLPRASVRNRRMLDILTFSTLYPNAAAPSHGIFVENRLRHLAASGEVRSRVVAPVPWFPFTSERYGAYAQFARCPAAEDRHGIPVVHPRYPVIPKLSSHVQSWLLYAGARRAVARALRAAPNVALIDAHYFYPDGVAAVMLGRAFGRPVTITARGTDLNLLADDPLIRPQIRWAAARADGLITVCQALKDKLLELGIPDEKVRVLRNGVDLEMFRPADRVAARAKFAIEGRTLLSVGLLIPRKAHDMAIRALASLPGVRLLIAGDGPERQHLEQLAREKGVADRVRLLGRVPHDQLSELYAAADALVLCSSREGWANVLLESMACGTPVIASDVWGTGEVVAEPAAGVLMPERTPAGLVAAYKALFAALPDRAATRAYAERFSWDDTTRGQRDLFESILARRASRLD